MDGLTITPLEQSAFGIEPTLREGELVLAFRGTGDLEAVESLGDYLESAFSDVQRLQLASIRFDFRALEFMNSSCFKAFVTFIERSKQSEKLAIVFVTDPNHYWQRRSLEALRRLAMGRVSIEA
jgi:hypothetical protein